MPKRLGTPAIVILILWLATAVGLYHIQTQSIWFDEGWSAYSAIQPNLQAAIDSDKTNPPLYYVIVNIAAHGLGDGEFALRWVSLAFGLVAIALAYQLGKQLFNRTAGIMAALLMAVSPLMWWASQEARMYTLLAVLVLLCAMAWHKLHAGDWAVKSWRWWLVLWLAELGLLYAHNTGPVVVFWLNVVTVLAWAISAIRGRWKKSGRMNLAPTMLLWFGGQIAVGILWLPYFVNRFLNLSAANSAVTSTSPFSADELSHLWQAVWTGSWAMVGREPLLMLFSAIVFVLALVLIPWRKANARWMVLHVAILTAGLWLALSILGNEVHGRYLVMITPLLLVAIAGGLSRKNVIEPQRRREYAEHDFTRYTVIAIQCGALGIFLVTFGAAVHFETTNPAYQHDDARAMVRYYANHLTTNDSALMWSYADRYELAYYWDRLGVKAKRITLPEGADLETVLPLLPKSGDVALNIWYTQRADYRGMMGCLLGDGTVNEPERFDVYGMTNLLFHAPTLRPPTLRPFDADLSMAKMTALSDLSPAPADRAICLSIQMTLTRPTNVDLKAAVRITNAYGTEIARTDAIFADRIQRLSSQLPVGSVLTAYVLLRLPYGAPAGDYGLHIRLYDEQAQPSGYDLTLDGQTLPEITLPLTRTSGSNWAVVTRATDLSVKTDVVVSDDLKLSAHNISGGSYHNGDQLTVALLWSGKDKLPDLQLIADDSTWQVTIPAPDYPDRDSITLDWRQAQIPLEAASGSAQLRLPNGTVLGSILIESIPAVYTQPKVDTPVNVHVPDIGTLVGYSISGDMSNHTQPFTLSLIWQAQQATAISYTVFAQLIGSDGRVLAQSDTLPANGARPTTGWRAGEYIIDDHLLTFHSDAAPATANLIIGLYDATTNQRVRITPQSDFITIQTGVVVQ